MLKAACFALLAATPAVAEVGKYCLKDADCTAGGAGGYCEDDPTKQPIPVYLCHGGADDDFCRGDGDCAGSYCEDDPTKYPVGKMYLCHVGSAPLDTRQVETETCESDDDCKSYCENDPTKTPPYSCHSLGGTCETDDDCKSYCEDDPTKTPPYYCHQPQMFTVKTYIK